VEEEVAVAVVILEEVVAAVFVAVAGLAVAVALTASAPPGLTLHHGPGAVVAVVVVAGLIALRIAPSIRAIKAAIRCTDPAAAVHGLGTTSRRISSGA
jgi:hypothetical protein